MKDPYKRRYLYLPLFAVIYDTVSRLVRRGLTRKGQVEVWEKYKGDYPDEE